MVTTTLCLQLLAGESAAEVPLREESRLFNENEKHAEPPISLVDGVNIVLRQTRIAKQSTSPRRVE